MVWTRRTPLGPDRDTYLQPVLRDRGNKTATERCKNPATKRTKPQRITRHTANRCKNGGFRDGVRTRGDGLWRSGGKRPVTRPAINVPKLRVFDG